ncbi:MAG TPA: histidine phosphatase family protein [Geminicoccaceae bacterium]|nr:histidine phosphatase family protein [Geminicoccaceae bacterium]
MSLIRFRSHLPALLVWAVVGFPAVPVPAAEQAALFDALREGGAVALIRHALAPGTGDPAGFRLDDCATQRNLSDAGREQARALGERLRAEGVARAAIYSSQWCRCLETARLLDLGEVRELPALNSFFNDRSRADQQTDELRSFLRAAPPSDPLVLVTHQVNIRTLTGEAPRSGEIIVVALPLGGQVAVLGRIPPPERASAD